MFSKCKPINGIESSWLVAGRQKGGIETEQNTVVPCPPPQIQKVLPCPLPLVYRKAEVTQV